jgi:hypothetical protein
VKRHADSPLQQANHCAREEFLYHFKGQQAAVRTGQPSTGDQPSLSQMFTLAIPAGP